MRTEEEIIKKKTDCFSISSAKQHSEAEVADAAYYSGAWYALLWVLEEEDDI